MAANSQTILASALATNAAGANVQQGAQFIEWLTTGGAHFPVPNAIAMILVAWLAPLVVVVYYGIMNKLEAMAGAKAVAASTGGAAVAEQGAQP